MAQTIHPLAGTRPAQSALISRAAMQSAYLDRNINISPLKNGTSGHRGVGGAGFNVRHVESMTQALANITNERGHFGPSYATINPQSQLAGIVVGRDVRDLSEFAQQSAIDVLTANGIPVIVQEGTGIAPTPVVSHLIHGFNSVNHGNYQGIIITASHNPPEEGGIKSNGIDGGPNTRTKEIDALANQLLSEPESIKNGYVRSYVSELDFKSLYVPTLKEVVDMDAIRDSGIKFVATPLGGSAGGYYERINEDFGTDIVEVLGSPDPAGANRTYDWDGKLRGDPSSKYVMQAVQGLREKYGAPIIVANDNDADRFGAEDATEGILDPNHVLCVLFDYLSKTRGYPQEMGIGRTVGTTHMLDLIAADYGRPVNEVPVGFKWYVEGLLDNKYVLAGEESAGLVFPRRDGSLWVTEKDGIAANLLMMEIIAKTGKDIGTLYAELAAKHGIHNYERIDTPATAAKKKKLGELAGDDAGTKALLFGKQIAGRSIERVRTGDGVKVVLEGGIWVLKRASGTEDIIKDYREERGDSLDTVRKASEELDQALGLSGI